MKYGGGSPFCFKIVKLRSSSSERIFTRGVCAKAQLETSANKAVSERTTPSAYQGWSLAGLGPRDLWRQALQGRPAPGEYAKLNAEILVFHVPCAGRLPVILLLPRFRVAHEQVKGSADRPGMQGVGLLAVELFYCEDGVEIHGHAAFHYDI